VIAAILAKEWVELRRDQRVVVVGILVGLLALSTLVSGAFSNAEQTRQLRAAQRDDHETFSTQGEKSPHSAAHFGRMAYKPLPPLAVFDPGAAPYLGQVVWLEAHRQGPAMFRPAEDALELRRLADLSPGGVLVTLLPLLVFLAGYGAFVSERERGTLRQIIGGGSDVRSLFLGKIVVLTVLGAGACFLTIVASTVVAVAAPASVSALDTLLRSGGLVLGYSAYGVTLAALALLVSAHARTSRSALLILLAVWALSVILVPRLAATVAESLCPTPRVGAFWAHMSDALRKNRPARDSAEYRALARVVLSRALGRDVDEAEFESAQVNQAGLSLEVSEALDAAVYAQAYRELYASYEAQRRMRRLLSLLSPTIALQHLSSALAGTDVAAHEHFVLEAERQRNLVVRTINEDLMMSGAAQRDYVAGKELWARVPDFAYRAPPAAFAFRSARWDLIVLLLWASGAGWAAASSARRLDPL
jgi:ABC-2 type transport system permease protein